MPSRVIRGEINASESLSRVSMEADLTFRALLVAVDDYGRLDARPAYLRAQLFPLREVTPRKLEGWIAELEAEGCLVRYEHEGRPYLYLTGWEKHRGKGRRAIESKYPGPPERSQEILGSPGNRPEIRPSYEGRVSGDEGRGTSVVSTRSARAKPKRSPPPADLEPEEHERLRTWVRKTLDRPDLALRLPSLVDACLTFHRAKGNTAASWYATCQTWIRNEAEERFGKPRRPGPVSSDGDFLTQQDLEDLARAKSRGRGGVA